MKAWALACGRRAESVERQALTALRQAGEKARGAAAESEWLGELSSALAVVASLAVGGHGADLSCMTSARDHILAPGTKEVTLGVEFLDPEV